MQAKVLRIGLPGTRENGDKVRERFRTPAPVPWNFRRTPIMQRLLQMHKERRAENGTQPLPKKRANNQRMGGQMRLDSVFVPRHSNNVFGVFLLFLLLCSLLSRRLRVATLPRAWLYPRAAPPRRQALWAFAGRLLGVCWAIAGRMTGRQWFENRQTVGKEGKSTKKPKSPGVVWNDVLDRRSGKKGWAGTLRLGCVAGCHHLSALASNSQGASSLECPRVLYLAGVRPLSFHKSFCRRLQTTTEPSGAEDQRTGIQEYGLSMPRKMRRRMRRTLAAVGRPFSCAQCFSERMRAGDQLIWSRLPGPTRTGSPTAWVAHGTSVLLGSFCPGLVSVGVSTGPSPDGERVIEFPPEIKANLSLLRIFAANPMTVV